MPKASYTLGAIAVLLIACACQYGWSRDGERIHIPRRSHLSPVQKLNREGVEAIKKREYDKAEHLFYKAYLYDPADPFTLNNLGYVSELNGRLDDAKKFYDLAAEQGSDANIDVSNAKHLQGQPMKAALVELQDATMRVNRMNLDAMRLLSQDRDFEAIALLRQALQLDPRNAFTLNNLGVANEKVSDLDSALRYYEQAAETGSNEPAVITQDRAWRGKSVSKMAEASARRLQKRMESSDPAEAKAIMYTLRGVWAENQNDWNAAREDFVHAYALDSTSAFTLNNRGFIAEREGDLETAEFFYGKARRADDASARVGMATRLYAHGQALGAVANDSNDKVDNALEAYSRERRQPSAPVELVPRGPGATQQDQNPSPNSQQTQDDQRPQ